MSKGSSVVERVDWVGGAPRGLGTMGRPCVEAPGFTCFTIAVPLDHGNPRGKQIPFRFAIRPAKGGARGTWVVAEGGPGIAGVPAIGAMVGAMPWLDSSLNVVAFDLRGTGGSGAADCPKAKALYEQDGRSPRTLAEAQALMERARRFTASCTAELGIPAEELPFYSTYQIVRDLDDARRWLGLSTWSIYGKSYGTQVAQLYAQAYPHATRSLVLDGVVDMELTHGEYNHQVMAATNRVLEEVGVACAALPACRLDFGGDPQGAFERVARRLDRGPVPYTFVGPSGRLERRFFDGALLDVATVDSLATPFRRMVYLRALSAADRRSDFFPLARVAYGVLGLDPATLEMKSSGMAYGMYHTIVCNDCGREGLSPEESAQRWWARTQEARSQGRRLVSAVLLDLPCSYWPLGSWGAASVPREEGPAPVPEQPPWSGPALVLAAESDPLTPPSQALAVARRLPSSVLLWVDGGHHVMGAQGNACIDQALASFMGQGAFPRGRELRCEAPRLRWYLPLPPVSGVRVSVADLAASVEREVLLLPELEIWNRQGVLSLGCGKGGTVALEEAPQGLRARFEQCRFGEGPGLSGEGIYGEGGDSFVGIVQRTPGTQVFSYERRGEQVRVQPRGVGGGGPSP